MKRFIKEDSAIDGILASRKNWKAGDFAANHHHFVPEFLGGKLDGPTIVLTAFEHHIMHQRLWAELAQASKGAIKHSMSPDDIARLIARGDFTREKLLGWLRNFYLTYFKGTLTPEQIDIMLQAGTGL